MFSNLFRKSILPEAGAIEENKVKSRKNSEDPGIEEGLEILDSENREEAKINGSLDVKEQDSTTTLKFHLTELLLNQVGTGKDNASANSGEIMYKDLCRMGNILVINNQGIDKLGVDELYRGYSVLISGSTGENRSYRQFLRKVFENLFKRAGESIPVVTIIEELITSCNQAGYDGSIVMQLFPIFRQYDFELKNASKRTIDIKYNNSNSLDINYCINIHIAESDLPEKEYEFHAVLEFTLEAQENDVAYKDGKVTFIIPEALENHPNGKNLLNGINEHFADADNSVIESLIGNIGEEHKSLVIDLTAEVDSDIDNSFDVIPENLTFDETVNAISKAVIDGNCEELEKIDSELQTLTSKDRQNILRDSLVAILENDIGKKSAHAIKYLCKNCSTSIVSALEKKENKKINNNTILNILSNVVELIKGAVDVKDVNILTAYVDVVQASVDHVSPKEGLLVVEKIEEIVVEFTKKQGEAWRTYPDVLGIRNIYAAGKYLEGYISQEDYEKIGSLRGTLYKIKTSLIADGCGSSSNKGSPIIDPKGATAVVNKTATSSQVVNEENNNQPREQKDSEPKSDSNLQVEENILAKNNDTVPRAYISNDYVRSKITVVGESTIPEELSGYIRLHRFKQVKNFFAGRKGVFITSEMYRSSLEAIVALNNSTGKKDRAMKRATEIANFFLEKIKEKEVCTKNKESAKHTNVELKEFKIFNYMEHTMTNGNEKITDTNSNVDLTIEEPLTEQGNNIQVDDRQEDEIVKVPEASSINEHRSNITANDKGVGTTINDQSTSIIGSNGENKQTSAQQVITIVPKELAVQIAQDTSVRDGVTKNDNVVASVSSNANHCNSIQTDDERAPLSEGASKLKSNQQDLQPEVLHAPESIDENSGKKDTQPKPTEVPLVANKDSKRVSNAQGSYPGKNNPAPQNARSKLPVIAASMLAITGVATGIAVAVYLEMLAVGIAVGACCLIAAAIVYYCDQPSKSLEKSSAEAVAATIGTPLKP